MKGTLQLPPQSLHWLALQGDLELCEMVQFAQRALEKRNRAPKAVVEKAVGRGATARIADALFELGKAHALAFRTDCLTYTTRPAQELARAERTAQLAGAYLPENLRGRVAQIAQHASKQRARLTIASKALAVSADLEGPCGRAALTIITLLDLRGKKEQAIREYRRFISSNSQSAISGWAYVNLQAASIRLGRFDLTLSTSPSSSEATWPEACKALLELNRCTVAALLENESSLRRALQNLEIALPRDPKLARAFIQPIDQTRATLRLRGSRTTIACADLLDSFLSQLAGSNSHER